VSNKIKRGIFFILLFSNSILLFSNNDALFKNLLIQMLGKYFNIELDENEIIFYHIINAEDIWSSRFIYLQSEYIILVDNYNLQVILQNDETRSILFEKDKEVMNNQSSIDFSFPLGKEWIYSYILYHRNIPSNFFDYYFYFFLPDNFMP